MPGIEIKGRSKRANYRHGGRTGFKHGTKTPMKAFKKDFPGGGPHQTLEGKELLFIIFIQQKIRRKRRIK